MKPFLSILVLTLGFVLAPQDAVPDLVVSRAVLEDGSGTLTIADVARREGLPAGPIIRTGSTESVNWIRLIVHAPAHGSKVVLFIRPNYLNEIRLYEADSGDPMGWKTRATGNHYPYGERDRASISLAFVVNVTKPEATYYLRFKTTNQVLISLEAIEPDEADRKDHRRDLLLMFFATAMTFLLLWAIGSYFTNRQRVVGLFAVHQAVYTMFGIAVTGYLTPLSLATVPKLVDWVNAILYLSINFTSLLYCRELFKPYDPPPFLRRGLNLLLCTFPFLLAASALGYTVVATSCNAVLIKITWVLFVVISFSLRVENTPRRRLLQVFFVCVLMTNLVFWYAHRVSWIASKINLSAVQVLVIDGLVIGGFFALMSHMRTHQILNEARQTGVDLLLVQKKFEVERELKKQIEVQAQTDYLTGQCNQRRFVELAERELTRAIRFGRPLTLLTLDFDRFKPINDRWGHNTGDAVLQKVSRLIRALLRDEDIFGRTGGDEFAAVIVETEGKDALDIAQRLCRVVADTVIDSPGNGRIPVSISIGLSELKGRDIQFNMLRDEADKAMYCAKRAGGNHPHVNG